jgi:hypothetical protein
MNTGNFTVFLFLFFHTYLLSQNDSSQFLQLQQDILYLKNELQMIKKQQLNQVLKVDTAQDKSCHLLENVVPMQKDSAKSAQKYHIEGAGAMNYYHFDWQTDTVKRDGIDNERFVLELEYNWTNKIGLNAELEFEHGGTGSAVEFDRFEEFGEFEFDISKGGEISVEQMNIDLQISKNYNLQLGRVKIPFGRMFLKSEPTDYLTAINSEMENFLLPENWTENGFLATAVFGKQQQLKVFLSFVNGLDCSAFNSANFIKRGNQARFELANAENFAIVARVDYHILPKLLVGASFYTGNTANNRPKPDLRIPARLALYEAHLLYNSGLFSADAMFFYGSLGNSEEVSNRNRNLSNNLNVKRTPVGAAALGYFAELGINILNREGGIFTHKIHKLTLFGRYDYYDTMFKTEGAIFNNPRWARQTFTTGLSFQLIKNVHFKTQYSQRKVGAPAPTSVNGGVLERTVIAGFAFKF